MDNKFEVIVNQYWMYENEPFHLCRFIFNETRYIIGYEVEESAGVVQTRLFKGYRKPEGEALEVYRAFRNA